MAYGVLGGRLLLAVIFVMAAAGKLRDRIGFRKTLIAFGVPARAVDLAGLLIPPAELAVAILLVPVASAPWGAAASLVLLAGFTTAVSVALARGRTPACTCFGTASSEPIGTATLARNAGLAACAVFVLVAGPGVGLGSAPTAWDAASADGRFLSTPSLALSAALVAMGWYAFRLRARNARLSASLESLTRQLEAARVSIGGPAGLPIGTGAPPFELPRLEGDQASLDTLKAAGLPVLLVFSDAYCSACAALWPDIARWQQEYSRTLTIAVVCSGPPQVIEMKLLGIAVANVLLAGEIRLTESYALSLTPSAVIVGADGRIASEGVVGVPAIRSLVAPRA